MRTWDPGSGVRALPPRCSCNCVLRLPGDGRAASTQTRRSARAREGSRKLPGRTCRKALPGLGPSVRQGVLAGKIRLRTPSPMADRDEETPISSGICALPVRGGPATVGTLEKLPGAAGGGVRCRALETALSPPGEGPGSF